MSGILFDLGVSSLQLDRVERGFSYSKDAPLDMRMDATARAHRGRRSSPRTARPTSRRIFYEYGEEKLAPRYARKIVQRRARASPIATSAQLVELIIAATPAAAQRAGHPAKRVFQALRIEVNQELAVLERAIPAALDALAVGGRIVVLSYQSLEDRIVKRELQRALVLDRTRRPAGRAARAPPGAQAARPRRRARDRRRERRQPPSDTRATPRGRTLRDPLQIERPRGGGMSTATALRPAVRAECSPHCGRPPTRPAAHRDRPVAAQRRARPKLVYAVVAVGALFAIIAAQLLLSIGLSDGAYQISALQQSRKELARTEDALTEDLEPSPRRRTSRRTPRRSAWSRNAPPSTSASPTGRSPRAGAGDQVRLRHDGARSATISERGLPLVKPAPQPPSSPRRGATRARRPTRRRHRRRAVLRRAPRTARLLRRPRTAPRPSRCLRR